VIRGVKAVLFDFDETLTDAQAGLEAAHAAVTEKLCEYLRNEGIEVEEERIGSELRKLDDEKNIRREYDRNSWWRELIAGHGVENPPVGFLEELTRIYWSRFTKANVPYPDAELVLEQLRRTGYKLGLVTDTDGTPGKKHERLKCCPLFKFFDVAVVGGEDTPHPKPDPEPFLLAAKRLGISASACVMIGDKPFTDIKGAKAAGMRTIRIKRREWMAVEEADVEIASLAELLRIL
jgi:putative hydrolase of the HAD superfamily